VALDRLLAPAACDQGRALAELGYERLHALVAPIERVVLDDLRREHRHDD
jgi:hypothetical protein